MGAQGRGREHAWHERSDMDVNETRLDKRLANMPFVCDVIHHHTSHLIDHISTNQAQAKDVWDVVEEALSPTEGAGG